MGTKIRIPPGKFQVHDTAEVGAGWKLYTYEPDTAFATPKETYKDKDGAAPHDNPIIFDSRGEKDIWWDGLYDIKLTDDLDNVIWTMEDVGQGAFEGEARTGPQAITHNITSDSDYTLTSSQEGYGRIIITDTLTTLTTGRNIICSTDEKGYYFQNDTAQTLTLKTSAGTGIAVPAGGRRFLLCDGTNVVKAFVRNEYDAVTITPASDANVTLTSLQAQFGRLDLVDGAWTTGRQIILPAVQGVYYVDNTAGSYDAEVIISGGTSVTVSAGSREIVLADGTNVENALKIANQAAMEAETAGNLIENSNLKYSPRIFKAFGKIDWNAGAPSIVYSSGIDSITDEGTGDVSVTWTTAFSDTDQTVFALTQSTAGTPRIVGIINTGQATGSSRFIISDTGGSAIDPASLYIGVLGDL